MYIIDGRKLNTKNLSLFYISLSLLLKIVSVNLIKLEYLRLINNFVSEIHLTIKGKGNQKILNNNFQINPSEVIVNGYRNDSCSKICYMSDDLNNITLKFSVLISSSKIMFKDSTNILQINLSNFDASHIQSMQEMFEGCSKLEAINFGDINTSSVNNMQHLFAQCFKISSIDLSKFDTSKVTSIYSMFLNCTNLKTINFGDINTSSVKNMRSLFNRCNNLNSINLSTFDTSHVVTFEFMFYKCTKLKYLDLSNFYTFNLEIMKNMFTDCKSLIYLNIYSFQLNYTVNILNAFKGASSNLIFCINDYFTKNYLFGNDSVSICLEPCSNDNNKKVNILYDGCIKSCLKYGFEYEYKNICYHECPKDTYSLFYDKKHNINNSKECFEQIPQGYYLDKNEKNYKKCYKFCKSCYGEGNETYNNCIECKDNFTFHNNSDDIKNCQNNDIYRYEYNNNCYKDYPDKCLINKTSNLTSISNLIDNQKITQRIITTFSDSEIIYQYKNNENLNYNYNFFDIKNESEIFYIIQKNFYLFFDSDKEKSQVIKGDSDAIFQITNSKNEKQLLQNNALNNLNLSILDLGSCEDRLKKEYNINDNDFLIYLKKKILMISHLKEMCNMKFLNLIILQN